MPTLQPFFMLLGTCNLTPGDTYHGDSNCVLINIEGGGEGGPPFEDVVTGRLLMLQEKDTYSSTDGWC